jgi:SAM-dependent methyltransferase
MTASGESHKAAARHAWSTGRYPTLAPNLLPAIARLVSAAGVEPGDAVVDVGCGTGNVALTARRTGAQVVGVDLAARMLELARENAAVTDHDGIDWQEGDAEHLPFRDDAFDVALSNFGHVFAPDAGATGRELVRVVRPGGRVAVTAWSPDGLVGRLTDVLTDHVDDPPEDPWAHLQWGKPEFVRTKLPGVRDLSFSRRIARFRYVSPEHFWREFAEESGPLAPALGRLDDAAARRDLRRDAVDTLQEWFADNAISVEYLQVRAVVD